MPLNRNYWGFILHQVQIGVIAVLILTGFDFNDEIEEALNTHLIHKFFTKPFEMQEIELAISEAIKDL